MEVNQKSTALVTPWVASEWWFFIMSILATINCLKRPDWNFAFALLSYCLVKWIEKGNYSEDSNSNVKLMVILLNAFIMFFDVIWIVSLAIIWNGRPDNSEIIWRGFSALHLFIIISSIIILILRAVAMIMLGYARSIDIPKNQTQSAP